MSSISFRYPNNAFTALKVFMWLPAIIIGLVVGKMIIHKWLFCHVLGMKLFTKDGQGSWMIMFLFTFVTIFTFAIIYNEFLKLEGSYLDPYHITSNMDMENATFMKVAGIGTWLGDFITAWMVTDMMLQVLSIPMTCAVSL